jgi:hypothetical protein
MLALALSWFAVSCAGPMSVKPASADSSMTGTASTQPSVAMATSSPWTGAGIFFYPFLLICLGFGVSIYMSGNKS